VRSFPRTRAIATICAGLTCSTALADSLTLQDIAGVARDLPEATVYVAERIITMDPAIPEATAVAVVGERIAAVGTLEEIEALTGPQAYVIDRRFEDKVLIAGFVEQHVHPILASLTMTSTVIAIEDWDTPEGFSPAARDPETYRARLAEAIAAHEGSDTFLSWGYHHYFHGEISRELLTDLAPDFPVIVWHRSCHEVFLNDAALEALGIDEALVATFSASEQAQLDLARGHFYEQGLQAIFPQIGPVMAAPDRMIAGLEFTETYYLQNGITTAAEPGGFLSKSVQDTINSVHADDATPFNHYFIPDGKSFMLLHPDDGEAMLTATEEVLDWGEGRVRFLPKQVKLFTDGAIYSQLMQMRDGYTDGHEGVWIMDPDVYQTAFQRYWDDGYQIHVHNLGDAGMDLLLDTLESALRQSPRYDHRTTIVHFGFATPEQIRRAARLGAIVSANPYYVTALAGRYAEVGIGPDRTARMVPLGDTMRAGISMSFHSDMPMAPARPLMLAGAAISRLTVEGEVAGPDQAVDLETALKAITIDAAFSIQLEDEIGSITPGKLANFTVLEDDPFEVDTTELENIAVWGTVLEGRVQQAPPLMSDRADFAPRSGGKQMMATPQPDGSRDVGVLLARASRSAHPGMHPPRGLLDALLKELD
jgi:predicted amidohydrolase YtcJ